MFAGNAKLTLAYLPVKLQSVYNLLFFMGPPNPKLKPMHTEYRIKGMI
jgi:hypothetical protein